MRIENIPVVLGILLAALGVGIAWDAWGAQYVTPMRERRRRTRAAIDTRGEGWVGVGAILLGAALVGRDWRFETLTVLIGTVLVLLGGIRNRRYIREGLLFRGAARRRTENPDEQRRTTGKMRIR